MEINFNFLKLSLILLELKVGLLVFLKAVQISLNLNEPLYIYGLLSVANVRNFAKTRKYPLLFLTAHISANKTLLSLVINEKHMQSVLLM